MSTDNIIKYTPEDVQRIMAERVRINYRSATFKAGMIAEYCFEYPNGKIHADVVCAFPVDPANADYDNCVIVCNKKIEAQIWPLIGQYSLITGEKL